MKTEEITILKKEFLRIKKMDYVLCPKNGKRRAEKNFKSLLNKKLEKFEIRVKDSCNTEYTSLFKANFDSNSKQELKRLRDTYGIIINNKNKIKVLNTSVKASSSSFVSNRFFFKLKINYQEEKIYLYIFDRNFNCLEKKIYWNFKTLETKLKRKFNFMAFLKVWAQTRDDNIYYKYYDMEFYHLRDFNYFLKALENGLIEVDINIEPEDNNKKIVFKIQELDLPKLFDKIIV